MTATLSIQDYLQHFLLNRDNEISKDLPQQEEKKQETSRPTSARTYSESRLTAVTKSRAVKQQNYGLMQCNVYQVLGGLQESLIYSKRIEGHKSMDMFGIFVQDMIGSKGMKASQLSDGRLSRASSVSDVSSVFDVEEGELQPNTSIRVQLISSRSPSNVGSAHLLGFLDHCKRNSIKVSINLRFAHSFSWDNKYNKEGLQTLHEKGVKLASISFHQILQILIDDVREALESLDQLVTCRGCVIIDFHGVNQAISALRQSLIADCDAYHKKQVTHLGDILGSKVEETQHDQYSSSSSLPATFPLVAYREYILLQNTDVVCAKMRVGVTKVINGESKEETAYEIVHSESAEKVRGKERKNGKNGLLNLKSIWEKVGSKVCMTDLAQCGAIIITVNALLSEYTGREGLVEEIQALHSYLRDMVEASELYKVEVETTIKYAHCFDAPVPIHSKIPGAKMVNGTRGANIEGTVGFPRGMRLECIHLQDILFEMLEDLEDNIRYLARIDYGRGANVILDTEQLARAMGQLNSSIRIQTQDGAMSMNDQFEDQYADDMNGI